MTKKSDIKISKFLRGTIISAVIDLNCSLYLRCYNQNVSSDALYTFIRNRFNLEINRDIGKEF